MNKKITFYFSTSIWFGIVIFSSHVGYGQGRGGQGELYFHNKSTSDMFVQVEAVGEYRWENKPEFERTSQYSGTNLFTVPQSTLWSVQAVWEALELHLKLPTINIK